MSKATKIDEMVRPARLAPPRPHPLPPPPPLPPPHASRACSPRQFHGAQMSFNGDISSWDTSKVSDAKMMVRRAETQPATPLTLCVEGARRT